VAQIEIRFTEQEVAQILWVLSEASELAGDADALSSVALIEATLRMVRERFDPRRPDSTVLLERWPSASGSLKRFVAPGFRATSSS
jgi:hypothetical protein